MLGSEYGWGKKQVLEEIYFDEYIDLLSEIKARRKRDYKMLLAISTNPHLDPDASKSLWETFEEENDYVSDYRLDPNAKLDKMGFDRLKLAMADNPHIIIQSE